MSHRLRDNRSRGRGRGSSNNNTSNNRRVLHNPRNPLDVERENVRILSDNFNSSELSYKGSDKIVFIPHEDEIRSTWKYLLKKSFGNQHHIRRFLNSCLVVTSSEDAGYELDNLITKLGEPDGRQRLKEIIMFPISVDAGLQPRVASFQRVTLPFLALLTRSGISDSILETNVNAIYSIVYSNLDNFMHDKVMTMLEVLVQRNSLVDQQTPQGELIRDDPNSFIPTSLGQFFLVIVRLCHIILSRIKDAAINETMYNISQRLENAKATWKNSFLIQQGNSNDPLYSDFERKNYFFFILDKEFKKVKQMIKNSVKTFDDSNNIYTSTASSSISYREKSQIADLKRSYDPPGELSKYGPRHNNDFSNISEISIIPTKEEILSGRLPFLPTNIPGAPHFLPEGAERLLDSQFRLLREDMLNSIRGGIVSFLQFLADSSHNNARLRKYEEIGGKYKFDNGQDNGDLFIYANARFVGITVDKRSGFSCRVAFNAPRNVGRSKRDRISYWQKSKKLMNGTLICLIWPEDTIPVNKNNNAPHYSLFFGVIVQRVEEQLARYEDRVEIDINFTDAAVYPLASKDISNRNMEQNMTPRFMIESTAVYLESYYHVLKRLQSTNDLPFEKYLTMVEDGEGQETAKNDTIVDVPDYARAPGFSFNLSVLLRDKQKQLLLNVSNVNEHKHVIKELSNGSRLDDTQAKAIVSSLCKEIALIEGPPGTGKTVVGVEIMKVLLAKENRDINLTPILTICFTNHALDQFLEHLIDAGIENIVRLGRRTKSDKIASLGLDEIARKYRLVGLRDANSLLNHIQEQAEEFQKKLNQKWLNWDDVFLYLSVEFEKHFSKFLRYQDDPEVPRFLLDGDLGEEWKTAGNRSRNATLFDKWLHGIDIKNAKFMIQAIENTKRLKEKKKEKKDNPNTNIYSVLMDEYDEFEDYDHLSAEDDPSELIQKSLLLDWQEPKTNRSLEELKKDSNIWKMSKNERVILHDFWKQELDVKYVERLAQLQKSHDKGRKIVDEIFDERRKKVLKKCDVIGMTTNGAAKFQSLIHSVRPKVILCEEAGEVLEAHILSALTPDSTQHLILIGDHNQLRPHIATYNLSCDSKFGKKYSFDESLFERLVKGDKATRIEKSQLLTQRRMRAGEISDLIRYTLYKDLVDGENTTKYPNVRGAQHNVYFINHREPEDRGKDDFAVQSHSNQYEVRMVIEMVKYFVRNGYTKQDDIAVLTPYLGQMRKLCDALKETFTVVIDERDSQDLEEMKDDEDEEEKPESNVVRNISVATRKPLSQQVTLRTVDNFQGEEASIVIISLVRNSGNEDDRGSIGFLKSTNRSNVLLSRARHGMYLLGNAELMAKGSPQMWARVIQMLKSRNPPQVGDSFPIFCPQHPNNRNNVKDPKQFIEFAPDGGCSLSCGQKLECGHLCPYKCHFDNPDHIDIYCKKDCTRLHPECNHPCDKVCGEKCGNCNIVIGDIILPSCGHTYPKAKCYETLNIMLIRCRVKVTKTLPKCGHRLEVMCYESIDDKICRRPCEGLNKCGHNCSAQCNECQKQSIKANNNEPPLDENGYIKRNTHELCKKGCEKNLFCGHKCKEVCHEGRNCKPCTEICIVSCSHSSCKLKCLEPCASCAEPCDWDCSHGKGRCLLSCGAPCSRLPCNLRCEKKLKCGHRCPGVCGENCPTPKFCEICAPNDVKEHMIDGFKTFSEIDWGKERMIILECEHVFTMKTMDRHMEMEKYYHGDYKHWIDIKMLSSQSGENKIMTCPNCRAPIRKIKRYGRSIKKRILDTQNKKFLATYDLHLKHQRNVLENIIKKMEKNRPNLLENFKNSSIYLTDNSKKNKNKNIVGSNEIVPEVAMSKQFYQIETIPESHASLWKKHVKELLNLYQQLTVTLSITKNPPYKRAFEAAVSFLYDEDPKIQLDLLFNNLQIAEEIESQKEHFEKSLRKVGLIAPQFDRRVYLDTFFEIVNVQKVMFHEVIQIVSELSKVELQYSEVSVLATRSSWIEFCWVIIDSIKNHLEIIHQKCKESEYGRHLALVSLELAEFEYQVCRFTLNNPTAVSVTSSIRKEIKIKCSKVRKDCKKILIDNLSKVELKDFNEQVKERINKLLKNVDELQEAAENFGQLTQEEKFKIFRAMSSEFSGPGHWYECPNGHPYTIGECGGPMQVSRCPDCRVTVGSGSHRLTERNRDETMTGESSNTKNSSCMNQF